MFSALTQTRGGYVDASPSPGATAIPAECCKNAHTEGARSKNSRRPSVPTFLSSPRCSGASLRKPCLFYDEDGVAHDMTQAEGGEQGDPLMPALQALGQHSAPAPATISMRGRRLHDVHARSHRATFRCFGHRPVGGKARAWNAAGEERSSPVHASPRRARRWARAPDQQGLAVLGTPVRHPKFCSPASRTCVSSTMRCYSASRRCPTCKGRGSSRAATTCWECPRPPEAYAESHDKGLQHLLGDPEFLA